MLIIFISVFSEDGQPDLQNDNGIPTISDSNNSDLEITDSTNTNSPITNSDTSLSTTDSTEALPISDTNIDSSTNSQDINSDTNSPTNSDTNSPTNSDATSSTSDSAPTTSDTQTNSGTTTPVILDLSTKTPDIIDLTTEANGNTTNAPSGVKPRIILLGFGRFQRPIRSLVTFKVYFKRFLAKLISNLLHFTVNVNYLRRLRLLDEQRADCTLISDESNGDMVYNCSVPVDPNKELTMSANNDFVFGDGEDRDLIISSYANKTMKRLSSQTGDIFENGILTLNNSTVTTNDNTFTIEGTLMEGELNDKQVTLSLDEEGNGDLTNVTCKVNNLGSQKYQLVCSSNKKVKTHLDGVMGKTSSKPLLINMKEGSDDEVDIDSSVNHIYPKKSSSGLSGGAIAGIIIACCVALIAAAVAAFLCNRGSKPALDQSSNNLKLNSSNSVQNNVYI